MNEKVVPLRPDIETKARREPLRQVLDILLLPTVIGLDAGRWLGGKALGVARENIEGAILSLDSHKLSDFLKANRLPDKVQTIENDIRDINKKEHEDKPILIAINAVSWYKAVREYHKDLIESGEKTSQDCVNQLLSMYDEAGVSHEELTSALSGTWVDSSIAKDPVASELLEHVQAADHEQVPASS